MPYSDYDKAKKTGIGFYICAIFALTIGGVCSVILLVNLIGFIKTII